MANKKMCKYWSQYGQRPMMPTNGGWCHDIMSNSCPNHTDIYCNIITRKPAKVKIVKAWARMRHDGSFDMANWRSGIGGFDIPCTITYRVDGKKGVK